MNPTHPLTPILRPESAHLFVDPKDVQPWAAQPDGARMTSALKFGVPMDLLSLSGDAELYESGLIHETDSLDFNIALDRVFYRNKSGDVQCLDCFQGDRQIAMTQFTLGHIGNYQELRLKARLQVARYSPPKGLWGWAMWSYRESQKESQTAEITIHGTVSLHLGAAKLDFISSPDITPLGYTLRAYRINHNRRARCPVMG